MASAELSPGAPSSFLVRALTSCGGKGRGGGSLSRELKAVSFTLTGRGREKGRLRGREEFSGLGGGA